MVAIRSRKVSTPAAKRVKRLPVRPQCRVIYRLTKKGDPLVEIQISSKSKQVKAVRNAFTRLCVELSDACVPADFPEGRFKAIRVGKPDKVRQKPRK